MKPSTAFKGAALVALAVCTSVVTSSFISPGGKRGAVQASQAADGGGERTRSVETAGVQPVEQNDVRQSARLLASTHWEGVSVTVDQGDVLIEAKASILDRRPGIKYLWGVQIKEGRTGVQVQGKLYADQLFFLNGDKEVITPTFSEATTLAPGDYTVVLNLYDIPPRFNTENLNNQPIDKLHRSLTSVNKIRIAE